ncbi:MAG: hypothetical protein IPN42_18375 [Methylococcaceae bacterium]|nr:hypothetical protein [Methylococcaceae bacterium]
MAALSAKVKSARKRPSGAILIWTFRRYHQRTCSLLARLGFFQYLIPCNQLSDLGATVRMANIIPGLYPTLSAKPCLTGLGTLDHGKPYEGFTD